MRNFIWRRWLNGCVKKSQQRRTSKEKIWGRFSLNSNPPILLSFIQSPPKTAWGQMSLLWPKRSLTWLQRDEREGSDGKKTWKAVWVLFWMEWFLLSSYGQIVRWCNETNDCVYALYLQVRCILEVSICLTSIAVILTYHLSRIFLLSYFYSQQSQYLINIKCHGSGN